MSKNKTGEQVQELGCNTSKNLPSSRNHYESVYKFAKQQHISVTLMTRQEYYRYF
jgi:hypothetical protein